MASELKYKKEEFEQSQIKNDESENQVKKLQSELKKAEAEEEIMKKIND